MHSKYTSIVLSIIVAILAVVVVVQAGAPDSPPAPPETTDSYTLEQIYQRLASGAAGEPITFTEPVSGPAVGTMHTLNDIMALAPAVDADNGAGAAQILTGNSAWGLTSGAWGPISGTMPDNGALVFTPTTTHQTIPAGYHDGNGYVAGDDQLVSANIRAGVSLFGVPGDTMVVNTSSGNALAGDILWGRIAWVDGAQVYGRRYPVVTAQTGQTNTYGTGDDGDLQTGVHWVTSTRFITTPLGTVTDTLTGLVWLQDAGCLGEENWSTALANIVSLNAGTDFGCHNYPPGLHSDWRLPNLRELHGLLDYGRSSPALPSDHPFVSPLVKAYWTSTTRVDADTTAWLVDIYYGSVGPTAKSTSTNNIWAVRGGD